MKKKTDEIDARYDIKHARVFIFVTIPETTTTEGLKIEFTK